MHFHHSCYEIRQEEYTGFSRRLYLCILEVMSPERSDFVLTTYIPYCETNIFILDRLYIKP